MLSFLEDIFECFSSLLGYLALLIIFAHILTRVFDRKTPVRLDKDSFVVITGACMGIGRQMALDIARRYNSKILVIDRRADLFDQITKEINEAGGFCECKQADLGSQSSVSELNNFLLKRKEPINMFIYNAGIMIPKTSWDLTDQEHRLVMNVNYFTPTVMIRQLQPLLRGQHIAVVVSMMAIIEGGIHVASYSASKHALYGYLASLRQEYQKFGKNITLSIGCPYAINTTMFKGFKTKLDFFVRVLDEKYVGERLVREFVARKEVCMMYLYEAFMFRIISFMPSQVVDFAAKTLDVSKYATMAKKSQ